MSKNTMSTLTNGTIVIQSFRKHSIPDWMARCLSSVQQWAQHQGFQYSLWGDEFYDLCGPEYLTKGFRNPQAITNLARLVATQKYLNLGYDAVIWLDADVFVFDREGLNLNFPPNMFALGYAFGREIWMEPWGGVSEPQVHNAVTYFTKSARDLSFFIDTIRHIDKGREITHNFQVGVQLLRGLQYPLGFEAFPHVAMFSPKTIEAINENDVSALKTYGQAFGYPSQAANLCLSQEWSISEKTLMQAMDILEQTRGECINSFATEQYRRF